MYLKDDSVKLLPDNIILFKKESKAPAACIWILLHTLRELFESSFVYSVVIPVCSVKISPYFTFTEIVMVLEFTTAVRLAVPLPRAVIV